MSILRRGGIKAWATKVRSQELIRLEVVGDKFGNEQFDINYADAMALAIGLKRIINRDPLMKLVEGYAELNNILPITSDDGFAIQVSKGAGGLLIADRIYDRKSPRIEFASPRGDAKAFDKFIKHLKEGDMLILKKIMEE